MKRIHLNALRRLRKAQDKLMRIKRNGDAHISLSISCGDGDFYTFALNGLNGDSESALEYIGELWTPTDEQTEAALARIGNVLGFDV